MKRNYKGEKRIGLVKVQESRYSPKSCLYTWEKNLWGTQASDRDPWIADRLSSTRWIIAMPLVLVLIKRRAPRASHFTALAPLWRFVGKNFPWILTLIAIVQKIVSTIKLTVLCQLYFPINLSRNEQNRRKVSI